MRSARSRTSLRPRRAAALTLFALAWATLGTAPAGAQEAAPAAAPTAEASSGPVGRIAVLPFRIHSARPLGHLTESLSQLLARRLES